MKFARHFDEKGFKGMVWRKSLTFLRWVDKGHRDARLPVSLSLSFPSFLSLSLSFLSFFLSLDSNEGVNKSETKDERESGKWVNQYRGNFYVVGFECSALRPRYAKAKDAVQVLSSLLFDSMARL